MMDEARQFPDPARIYHYVPSEICVVVSTPVGTVADPYHAIQSLLNRTITPLLQFGDAQGGGSQNPDMADEPILGPTSDVWKQFQIARDDSESGKVLFRPPARATGMRSVHLRQKDGTTVSLHFFRAALDPNYTLANARSYARVVPQLVNLIHRNFIENIHADAGDGLKFHAVSPNWLSFFSGCGDNGPGTPAVPVKSTVNMGGGAYAQFHFRDDDKGIGSTALEKIVSDQRAASTLQPLSGIEIAVLDTCPSPDQVKAAADKYGPHNRILRATMNPNNPVVIGDDPKLDPKGDFRNVIPFLPNYLGGLAKWYDAIDTGHDDSLPAARENYGAPDHGLFVSGIIKDIAPNAKVRLIRVLDDSGVGDLLGIAWALSLLAMGAAPRRLIINLSLTFDIPTIDALKRHWLEISEYGGEIPPEVDGRLTVILTDALKSIAMLFAHLREKEVLVVAAAGNNARGPDLRPDACLPAGDPTVFSVSSVNRDDGDEGGASFFSNKSDECHGIATVSGDGVLGMDPPRMLMENPPERITDGVQGIFSGKDMIKNTSGEPTDRDANVSGWVYWAGTSFSTPIISAIAAAIQANELAMHNDPLDPAALIRRVQSFADADRPNGNLGCPVIYAYQA